MILHSSVQNTFSSRFLLGLAASVSLHVLLVVAVTVSSSKPLLLSPLGTLFPKNTGPVTIAFVNEKTPSAKSSQKLNDGTMLVNSKKKIQPEIAPAQNLADNAETLGTENGTISASELSKYLMGLRQQIEKKKLYPAQARRLGETGLVLITLSVLKDGTLENVKIKNPSRYARLNDAALNTVSSVQRYQPFPDSINQEKVSVDVPLEFTL